MDFKDITRWVPFAIPFNSLFLFSRNPANYKIVVGDHNRNTNEGTEEEVGAQKIISHPQYNTPRLSSDIALIQLSQAVKLSQRVNPICLPSHDSDIPTGSKCYITGGQGSTMVFKFKITWADKLINVIQRQWPEIHFFCCFFVSKNAFHARWLLRGRLSISML